MKTLLISDVPLRNPSSGSEQVLYHQARSLAEIDEGVYAITRKNGSGPIHFDNRESIREATYFADPDNIYRFTISIFKYPAKIFKKFNTSKTFDIIICHQPFTCFTLILKRCLWGIPIIYNFHSPSHEEYLLANRNVSNWKIRFQAYLRKWTEGFCIKRAKRVITESHYMADKVQRIHRISIEIIRINPGGVDLRSFQPRQNRCQLKDKLNYPPGRIHLLTVRNLDYRMGLDNLIQAVKILKEREINVHLTIGGEGPERGTLEAIVETLDLKQAVTINGFIPSDDLVNFYAAADFFILPTRKLEGFGLVTPEAMACGTPVLGTPVGGTKEILSGFNSDFLFEDTSPRAMAEGIQSAINGYYFDKDRYESLRQQCRKFVEEKYSWDRHVAQLKDVIAEVVLKGG